MDVVYDPAKDRANINKHDISLARAKDFDFGTANFELDDSQDYGEIRINAVGFLGAELYSLTFTEETDNIVRAISFRQASRQEQRNYAAAF